MIQLSKGQCHILSKVFAHSEDTTVWSCLQGYTGTAWADRTKDPRCGKIAVGNFCMLAGDPSLSEAREIAAHLPEKNYTHWYFIGENDSWNRLIEDVWGDKAEPFERYAIKKEGDVFDRETLRRYAQQVCAGYEIRPMDEELCRQAMAQEWSQDACGQFSSIDEYLKHGLGFAAVCNGELAAEASSYSIYDKGFEITIATKEEHRRRGLARACAAHLMLAGLERGLYPAWDAKTMISVQLSEQLGYHFDHPYRAYCIRTENSQF